MSYLPSFPRALTVASARAPPPQAAQPQNPWSRGKLDLYVDPRDHDESLNSMLEGYIRENINKPSPEYPLKIRIDKFKYDARHIKNKDKKKKVENSYPRKYVTMFVLDTEKGRVVAPSISSLMDKFDQRQLKRDDDGNLEIQGAVYTNDKVLEYEYLKEGYDNLSEEDKERYEKLVNILKYVSPGEIKENIPAQPKPKRKTRKNLAKTLRESEAAVARAQSLTQQRIQQNAEHASKESLANRIARLTAKGSTQSALSSTTPSSTPTNIEATLAGLRAQYKDLPPPDPRLGIKTRVPLPPGWTESVDMSTGKTYYISPDGQTTQWDPPTAGGKRTRHRKRHHMRRRNKTKKH